jgi:hypothetical protein
MIKSPHDVAIEIMIKTFEVEFAIKYRRTKSVKSSFGKVLAAYKASMIEQGAAIESSAYFDGAREIGSLTVGPEARDYPFVILREE